MKSMENMYSVDPNILPFLTILFVLAKFQQIIRISGQYLIGAQ